MKRNCFILFCIFLFAGNVMTAQQKNVQQTKPADQQQESNKVIVLKPTFELGDVVFVLQAIGNVEISGSTEVEAFLTCKNVLQQIVETAQKNGKKNTDKISVEIKLPHAQNILTLLNRAKFAGAFAENYKRFVDALVESAKPYQAATNTK